MAAAQTTVTRGNTASAEDDPDMCWISFGQRFGHACNIGFVDLLRSGALQRAKSTVPRGAGMNVISEILASRQRAARSGPFSDPRDSQQSLERVSAHDFTWLPRGKCNRPNSARRSLDSRSRQTEALLSKFQGICQSYSLGQIIPKVAKPACSHV